VLSVHSWLLLVVVYGAKLAKMSLKSTLIWRRLLRFLDAVYKFVYLLINENYIWRFLNSMNSRLRSSTLKWWHVIFELTTDSFFYGDMRLTFCGVNWICSTDGCFRRWRLDASVRAVAARQHVDCITFRGLSTTPSRVYVVGDQLWHWRYSCIVRRIPYCTSGIVAQR